MKSIPELFTDAQRPGGGLGGGGAPRSESQIPMIAGGNHTIMYGSKSGCKAGLQ